MRLWSLHPRYLDAKGLVALWREALLARAVLRGETRGYTHHPQLERFQAAGKPLSSIEAYLAAVYREAERRGYRFDPGKVRLGARSGRLEVTRGQLDYELRHLRVKLARRSPADHAAIRDLARPAAHPLFRVVPGPIADWEKSAARKRR